MGELHTHCVSCVNRRCMTRPEAGLSCDLIGCSLVCGAIFHSCKSDEHRLLCPLERVPCLNSGFGCPFSVTRNRIAEHLEVCPASVVCCTMEWNRWPVSYADRKSYENLSKDVDVVEQLDMALALQDQRMLLESLKVAGAVSKNVGKQVSSNENVAVASRLPDAQITNGIIGMDEESYSELYQATLETSRSLAAALDILSSATKEMDLINGNISMEKAEKNGAFVDKVDVEVLGYGNVEMKESDMESVSELGAVGGIDQEFLTDYLRDGNGWTEPNGFIEILDEGLEDDGLIGLERKTLPNGFHFTQHNRVEVRQNGVDFDGIELKHPETNGSFEMIQPENREELPYCHPVPSEVQEPPVSQPTLSLPLALPLAFPLPDLIHDDAVEHLPGVFEDRWLERKLQNLQVLRGMSMYALNGRRAFFTDAYSCIVKMEDKSVDTSDLEVTDDPMGLHGIDVITAALLFCLGDSPGGRGISDSRFVDGYRIDFGTQTFSFPSAILATNTMVGDIASASACDHANPQLSNPSPFHTLRLDLVLECVARYQTKQRSMFTFVCGQLFRRDEFSSHFKNVHGDIHAGLNGWMEQRCPLAYYGCTYSQRRFCPSVQGSKVVHDRHLGSFGVQPNVSAVVIKPLSHRTCALGPHGDRLSSLPFEILQHIALFLDGFSLCQLSRVSHLMRNVCSSLLHVRGMVVPVWEKQHSSNGFSSWQIKDKVWRFSTAFGTVEEWKFADIASMADHLKVCCFNTVERREEAVPLPCMCFTRELTKDGRSLRSVLKPVL
ncbi:F-box only protein 30a [Scleropages formosus]|uniref:F-box protein 30a n=1 Tax=Scleropages formosus TaxID=113540 RepID=A0A8C9V412_SCLFO|nr:F-box only protein 30-like [Scleropages formosus]